MKYDSKVYEQALRDGTTPLEVQIDAELIFEKAKRLYGGDDVHEIVLRALALLNLSNNLKLTHVGGAYRACIREALKGMDQ
ncbi:hypothetical protein KC887_02900 [Candidatus Kaiserbacteria bacterium]|nr:hypothetical protein [Candidatus Kaiserbacteria bacterium]